jgi:hypothetical protein
MKPKNWKTTAVGLICIAMGIVSGLMGSDWTNALAFITAGAGFIIAGDAK